MKKGKRRQHAAFRTLSDLFSSHLYNEFCWLWINHWPVTPLLKFTVINCWSCFCLQKASVILIDFLASRKCVFLYAAWSTLFLIGLFLSIHSIIPGHLENGNRTVFCASTFLLVKYTELTIRCYIKYIKTYISDFAYFFCYSHYPLKPIKPNQQFIWNHGDK